MSNRTQRVIGVSGIALTAVLVTWILSVIDVSVPTPVNASGTAYQFETHVGSDSVFYINIDLLDSAHLPSGEEDYTAYKSENDSRIDGWIANPTTAPTIVGHDIAVTFKRPLSGSAAQNLISSANVLVENYNETASHSKSLSGRSYSINLGPIDAPFIDGLVAAGPVQSFACTGDPSHEACYTTATTGVISVFGKITSNGLSSLSTLRTHPDVYLVDSTGIDYLVSNPPSISNYAVMLLSLIHI